LILDARRAGRYARHADRSSAKIQPLADSFALLADMLVNRRTVATPISVATVHLEGGEVTTANQFAVAVRNVRFGSDSAR